MHRIGVARDSASHRLNRQSRGQRGFSLVEMLVALVSASVGLLGVAALQLATLRTYQSSSQRIQASTLATSMLEQVRSHKAAALNGEYEIAFNDANSKGGKIRADVQAWQREIVRKLSIDGDSAGGSIHTDSRTGTIRVTIAWRRTGHPDTSQDSLLTFSLESRL